MGCAASRPAQKDGATHKERRSTTSTSSPDHKTNNAAIAIAVRAGHSAFLGPIEHPHTLTLPPPSAEARTSADVLRAAAPPILFSNAIQTPPESLLGRKRSHDLCSDLCNQTGLLERRPTSVRRSSNAEGCALGGVCSRSDEVFRHAGDSTPGMGSITGWQFLAQQV